MKDEYSLVRWGSRRGIKVSMDSNETSDMELTLLRGTRWVLGLASALFS